MFNQVDIEIANKTSRSRGAVGKNALVPRIVRNELEKYNKNKTTILDFGAGKEAIHAQAFLKEGWACTAYEFGDNVDVRYHNELALMQQYDIVYASNVLNVQTCFAMARRTISQIFDVVKDDGVFIGNYPASPRKSDMTQKEMAQLLLERFDTVKRIAGNSSAPCWIAYK